MKKGGMQVVEELGYKPTTGHARKYPV